MAQNPRRDRSRSPPLHAHTRGDNKAWSNIGVKIYVTTPTYVSVANHNLGSLSFEKRSIAGPDVPAGPAGRARLQDQMCQRVPAGPAGPGAGAGPAAGQDDEPAGPNEPSPQAVGPKEPADSPGARQDDVVVANEPAEPNGPAEPNCPEGPNGQAEPTS